MFSTASHPPGRVRGLRLSKSLPAAVVLALTIATQAAAAPPQDAPDWLLGQSLPKAGIRHDEPGQQVHLENGLIRRSFTLAPAGATVAFDNLMTGASLLRAVKPEALLTLNGAELPVGGLTGQPDHAYLLPEWIGTLRPMPQAMALRSWHSAKPAAPFPWIRKRHAANLPWPPQGVALDFLYTSSTNTDRALGVTVHYELYDGLPLLGKWLTVSNGTGQSLTLDRVTTELLAAVEAESAVDTRPTNRWRLPPIAVLSDYSFGGMDPVTSSRVTEWLADPEYRTQVHYHRQTPCLLVSRPPIGPGVQLEPGQTWTSWRTWLLVQDSDDRERQGLGLRRAMRTLAPWCTENPLMMHVRSADTATFRAAVDQCAAVGFEMIIYTFGSGIDLENENPAYQARIKADVDFAHSRGIEVGAYSLFSSRHIDEANDVIHPDTRKPGGAVFGHAPCLGSSWGTNYLRRIRHFIETTGLDLLEHDGPYPGDVCASTQHPGHRGLADSQWTQWRDSAAFYAWCRSRGLYVNAPDFYFLTGSSKTGMGYREDNWSLPRAQQLIHGRQNIFDGTYEKTPTMGWMFVPLTEYHGGGQAATLEPLDAHRDDYEAHLANNLGAGVQACYRGPRLYDTDATRNLLARWVRWFKEHRDILESDIIHLRRADGRDLDYFLHVNPQLKRCGLAMVYNPLPDPIEQTLTLPLYYTGLAKTARIRQETGPAKTYPLDRQYRVRVPVRVPANGRTWILIERP